MDKFFNPKSVVVIGVSERASNMARNIVANLHEFGFDGIIYAVGHKGGKLFGSRIYKSVKELPEAVDLAVILTPAAIVPEIIKECGKKGINRAIIESAGFREFGEKGKQREEKLIKYAKKYGIRFIGPNCIGTMNLRNGLLLPFINFNDVFMRGKVSIVSQSGGVAFNLLNILASESIGMAKIASIGNKLNVDENDIIEYYINDDETDIILVYLEGISDGKRLMKLAAGTKKPILLHKGNIGKLGQSLAASHTAALSSDDVVVSAALKQCGIARFIDKTTLTNYLKILPLPKIKGNSLAILSRSGGHAILAADAAEISGFTLASFKPAFIKDIEKHVRADVIRLTNPLDLGDLFDYDLYLKIIEKTIQEKNVDAVVFLHTYFSTTEGEVSRQLIEKTNDLSHKYNKPIIVCVATDEEEIYKLRKELKQPIFTSPGELIRALELSRDFSFGVGASPTTEKLNADKTRAKNILNLCKKKKSPPLLQEGLDIFDAYKIPVIPSRWVTSEDEAVKASNELGYPTVMKIVAREISHKTDIGGVHLNLKKASHVEDAYKEMMQTAHKKMPKAKIEGVVVQPMLKRGWEMIIGAKRDENFGPVVLVGLGGIFVEVFKDTAMRVVPFSKNDAEKMLTELKGYPILKGARGRKPYDTASIIESIMNLARLMTDFPEIKEVDINPFYILPKGKGGLALDARIVL